MSAGDKMLKLIILTTTWYINSWGPFLRVSLRTQINKSYRIDKIVVTTHKNCLFIYT
jgi:hypothetical protein